MEAIEPVGEERLFIRLGHASDGEMQFLPGGQADAIFIDPADLRDGDLHAVLGVAGAIELEAGTTQDELAGTAAEGLVVAGVVVQRRVGRTGRRAGSRGHGCGDRSGDDWSCGGTRRNLRRRRGSVRRLQFR